MNETLEYYMARIGNADRWVPACGGTETPYTTRTGIRVLYCWNPFLNQHGYINTQTDMLLSDDEVKAHIWI